MISPEEARNMLRTLPADKYLLLDLRVAPQYAQSRIRNSLSLCIPTTLLKRPSFNLAKLTDTFKNSEEHARFCQWRECEYIILYDAASTATKDALAAMNTIKKFTSEGWAGKACIIRGGFQAVSAVQDDLIDRAPAGGAKAANNLSLGSLVPDVAPVAGGCEMPTSKGGANPFFSNIRQNMDLVGGVGQIDVKRPENPDMQDDTFLPPWLSTAAKVEDHGKIVSDKFLHIEQEELSRMRKALSSRVSYGTPNTGVEKDVQIAGFEKGSKNRYNNIWPFEHARVRLQGRSDGACDYVNASHIKPAWSNKRYIASQGPLPATFEVCHCTHFCHNRNSANLSLGFLERHLGSGCSRDCYADRRVGRRTTQMPPVLGGSGIWAVQSTSTVREARLFGSTQSSPTVVKPRGPSRSPQSQHIDRGDARREPKLEPSLCCRS